MRSNRASVQTRFVLGCSVASMVGALANGSVGRRASEIVHASPVDTSYRLVATWSVPPVPLTWPNRPTAIRVARYMGELNVVDRDPPRVLVLGPDGGVLRTIGAGSLAEPHDVAVVHMSLAGDMVDLNPSKARMFVTEPSLGQVRVFTSTGGHVRTIDGLGEPWGAVGMRGRVYVTDRAGGRVIVLDYDGNVVATWGSGGASPLDRPGPITAVDPYLPGAQSQILVGEQGSKRVSWWSTDGTWMYAQALGLNGVALVPFDIALQHFDIDSRAIVATTEGLVGVDNGGRHPFLLRDVAGRAGRTATSIALFAISDAGWTDIGAQAVVLLADAQRPGLQRYYVLRDTLLAACPWPDADEARPWRISWDVSTGIVVALSNGSVVRLDPDGSQQRVIELGDVDDLALDGVGGIWVSTRGDIRHLDSAHVTWLRDRTGPSNWTVEYDCSPAGYGLQLTVDATLDGRVADVTHAGLWPTFSQVNHNLSSQLQRHCTSYVEGLDCFNRRYWRGYAGESSRGVHWLANVVTDPERNRTLGVDRWNGRIVPFGHPLNDPTLDGKPWPIVGRPDRAVLGPDGHVFVLTVEGVIWELDAEGRTVSGWDAAGAPNGERADVVDIAVDRSHDPVRVYAADRAGGRILVFEPGAASGPEPQLPSPCAVEVDKNAAADTAFVGTPITVTLSMRGGCGRSSAASDILILVPPRYDMWATENRRQAASVLLDAFDPVRDRVGVMLKDSSGTVLAPFSHDAGPARSALANLSGSGENRRDVQPLDLAREYVVRNARPDANRVVIIMAPVTGVFLSGIAAERMRRAGIRAFVVADHAGNGLVAAQMAYQLEDTFFAPDAATLREVYGRLGSEISTANLFRQLTVVDTLPANMDVITSTLRPPATWDPDARTLTWRTSAVSFGGWSAAIQVVPRAIGFWPTNASAVATYIDGLGRSGVVTFPVPYVRVAEPPPTPTASPSPKPTATATNTPLASEEPTPTIDPAGGHRAYLPLAARAASIGVRGGGPTRAHRVTPDVRSRARQHAPSM